MIRGVAILLAGLLICGCAATPEEFEQSVLIRARVLFPDPEEQQPKRECPKSSDPRFEAICLGGPAAFTVAVREVLIGRNLPRQLHAILVVDNGPSQDADIYIAGRYKPSGQIEAFDWRAWQYVGCDPKFLSERLRVGGRIEALQRANRLPCVNPARR